MFCVIFFVVVEILSALSHSLYDLLSQVDILQTQKCTAGYCTQWQYWHTRTQAHTQVVVSYGGGGGGGAYWLLYMQIWREEFLRLAWKKMLMVSDEHHTVMSSIVLGPWKLWLSVTFYPWRLSKVRHHSHQWVTIPGHADKTENSTCMPHPTLRVWALLSGTFLQTLPDLVMPLKGHSLFPHSCPPTRSVPSERFGY